MRKVAKGFTDFWVDDRCVVESVTELAKALQLYERSAEDFLDATYVVELVCETLTDGSEKRSVRLRLADPV